MEILKLEMHFPGQFLPIQQLKQMSKPRVGFGAQEEQPKPALKHLSRLQLSVTYERRKENIFFPNVMKKDCRKNYHLHIQRTCFISSILNLFRLHKVPTPECLPKWVEADMSPYIDFITVFGKRKNNRRVKVELGSQTTILHRKQ